MISHAVARGMLLTLARHLRPTIDADLTEDGSLLVSDGSRTISVNVVTTLLDPGKRTPAKVEYSNVRSGEVYGSIAHAEDAAKKIIAELDSSGGT